METRLKIILSYPKEKNLSDRQCLALSTIRTILENEKDICLAPISSDLDRLEERYERLLSCQGILVVAFSQWEAHRLSRDRNEDILFPSEFTHIANVFAVIAKKPLLVLCEKGLAPRGSLRNGYIHPVLSMPRNVDDGWFKKAKFNNAFSNWLNDIRKHQHVFLGYSSQSRDTARSISLFLRDELQVSVLDWHDFSPSGSILQRIEEAEKLTICGIFLFMADDDLDSGGFNHSVPRDNVIYEAGYFSGAKGKEKTLIVREKSAKVPTDLGGIIFAELQDRNDISPIEKKLRKFLERVISI